MNRVWKSCERMVDWLINTDLLENQSINHSFNKWIKKWSIKNLQQPLYQTFKPEFARAGGTIYASSACWLTRNRRNNQAKRNISHFSMIWYALESSISGFHLHALRPFQCGNCLMWILPVNRHRYRFLPKKSVDFWLFYNLPENKIDVNYENPSKVATDSSPPDILYDKCSLVRKFWDQVLQVSLGLLPLILSSKSLWCRNLTIITFKGGVWKHIWLHVRDMDEL